MKYEYECDSNWICINGLAKIYWTYIHTVTKKYKKSTMLKLVKTTSDWLAIYNCYAKCHIWLNKIMAHCFSVVVMYFLFRTVMVIVATEKRRTVESIQTEELKAYKANTKDPYITAYLKTDVLSSTFVIGDGKEYNSETEKYFNRPLRQNSSYIVFLRFFENEVNSAKQNLCV